MVVSILLARACLWLARFCFLFFWLPDCVVCCYCSMKIRIEKNNVRIPLPRLLLSFLLSCFHALRFAHNIPWFGILILSMSIFLFISYRISNTIYNISANHSNWKPYDYFLLFDNEKVNVYFHACSSAREQTPPHYPGSTDAEESLTVREVARPSRRATCRRSSLLGETKLGWREVGDAVGGEGLRG